MMHRHTGEDGDIPITGRSVDGHEAVHEPGVDGEPETIPKRDPVLGIDDVPNLMARTWMGECLTFCLACVLTVIQFP